MATFLEQLEQSLRQQQPIFRPTALGLLNNPPQAEMKTPESFVPTGFLGDSGRQTAKELSLLGLGFAPGAGFSDYAGTYPSAQGGFEPSAQQNWQQGNYGTAALQALGALGDAATLTGAALGPLGLAAGGVIGSVAKAPRNVQRGVSGLIDRVAPKIDELGFFSQVEKSVMDIPQQKGTGQQFLAQIQKTPGVKPEELQYTGLDQFLANKPTVTKGEIQDYLDANRVQLQEVRLGAEQFTPELFNSKYGNQGYQMAQTNDGPVFYKDGKQIDWSELPEKMQNSFDSGSMPQTKWHLGAVQGINTEIPGGENYREVLLTLPDSNTTRQSKLDAINEQYNSFLAGRAIDDLPPSEKAIIDRLTQEHNAIADAPIGQDFRSSHFNQPNILAHMRLNDRTVDGKPTLFVEEIQSDWHQAGRKKGYATGKYEEAQKSFKEWEEQNPLADPAIWREQNPDLVGLRPETNAVPDAPFKTSWHELTLKKAINEAATKGYDQIAFTTGKTQAERYNLSKQIDTLRAPFDNGEYAVSMIPKGKDEYEYLGRFTANTLPDAVGKEMAEKIIADKGKMGVTYSGMDLSVGGEGMKGFYDKIVPKSLEKMGKKYGVKPVLTEMDTPNGKVQVWKFPIPKEMRETVKSQGQPLFQIGAGAGLGTAGLLATEEDQY